MRHNREVCLNPAGLPKGEWALIHRCRICGALSSNCIAADDNPLKLMSLAVKPVACPPFPLERLEELARLTGCENT